MKLSLVFLLLLDVPLLKGQQRIEEFEQILLRLSFPSFYNSYSKSCCKLYPGGCYKLLDSAGYICELLRGRVTKTEMDGWIEFKISNVQLGDGGFYRCGVLGTQNHIYRDYYVEVFEASNRHSQSQPPISATIKAPNASTTLPDSTGAALAQDHSDISGVPWSVGLPLAIIASIAVMIVIASVVGVVCCRVKAKSKQSDKYGETRCESVQQEAPDMSGIVYTTVDFRTHQKPDEVYANLSIHKARAEARDTEHAGMVEYSILAVR